MTVAIHKATGKTVEIIDASRGWLKIQFENGDVRSARIGDLTTGEPSESLPEPVTTLSSEEIIMEAATPAKETKPRPQRAKRAPTTKAAKSDKKSTKAAKPDKKLTKDNGARLDNQPMSAAFAEYRASYVKGARSLHCGDEIAVALDGLTPADVVAIARGFNIAKPTWATLNPGQQRMTAGNVLRNAVKRGDITLTALRSAAKAKK